MADKREAASQTERTISAETMEQVMKFAPMDGFKLHSDLLDQEYTVVAVSENNFNNVKSFTMKLANDKNVINLSAGAFKKSRIAGAKDLKMGKIWDKNENISLRGESDEIWNGSEYVHAKESMVKDDNYIIPDKLYLFGAVLTEDRDKTDPEPAINPFFLKGYRKVVTAYGKREPSEFPTLDDFKEELAKTDDRIAGLPKELKTLEPFAWVKEGVVSNYKHTLIFKDLK